MELPQSAAGEVLERLAGLQRPRKAVQPSECERSSVVQHGDCQQEEVVVVRREVEELPGEPLIRKKWVATFL